jgi:transketolase
MRDVLIAELIKEASVNEKIILIVGDLGFSVVEPFAKEFPDRFINAGICEQNMASLSAGMASEGYKVFTYSIGNFATFRCAEQIRNDICYHNLDVTTIAVGGGVSYGNLGYSHHAIQDYGLMRLFPEMTILSPGDPLETKACLEYSFNYSGPKYLRLRKAGEVNYTKGVINFNGKWNKILQSKNKKILLTTGYGMEIAFGLIKTEKFKDYGIYSCPVWGMNYSSFQHNYLESFEEIITIEDHLLSGGFGSWIREGANNNNQLKIKNGFLDISIIGQVSNEKTLLSSFTIK